MPPARGPGLPGALSLPRRRADTRPSCPARLGVAPHGRPSPREATERSEEPGPSRKGGRRRDRVRGAKVKPNTDEEEAFSVWTVNVIPIPPQTELRKLAQAQEVTSGVRVKLTLPPPRPLLSLDFRERRAARAQFLRPEDNSRLSCAGEGGRSHRTPSPLFGHLHSPCNPGVTFGCA